MKHHNKLTTENYNQALDCVPWQTFRDDVFRKLIEELENKTALTSNESFISNELRIDLFFLMVKAFELGRARGKQAERSRRHKQAIGGKQ